MLRAVPATMFMAASTSLAFRSGIFSSAISRTWALVTVPTLFLFGSPEPFSTFAALASRMAAGGVFVMNVNDLSEKTVIQMIRPACPASSR